MHALEQRLAPLLGGARSTSWLRRSAPWQPTDAVAGGNDRFTVQLDDGRRVAPTVREHQRRQLEVALAWCERELLLA